VKPTPAPDWHGSLIKQEIDCTKLPKRALNILEKCDPYINHFNRRPSKPNKIPLYEKDYILLAEKLKEDKQDITERTSRGYRLVQFSGGDEQ
jgi:hypothetical protein